MSIEELKPQAPRRRILDDDDDTSLHSVESALSLDSEVDDVKKPSEMVSELCYNH